MTHLNNASNEALSSSNNTLEKRLYSFLSKMLDVDKRGVMLSDEMQELNEDVVYFVLNGTDIRNDERAFVAALNWENLEKTVLEGTFLEKTYFTDYIHDRETICKTHIYSSNYKNTISEGSNINQYWNLIWEEYLRLTIKEEKNKHFTFNHRLLNYTDHPLNIGIYWGSKIEANKIDNGYIHIPKRALEKLGVLKKDNDTFNALRLSKDFTRTIIKDSSLSEIAIHFSEMGGQTPELSNINNIGFTVYHLIRSYGCWGGTAFYSIPVNYGSAKEKRTGVLSICTTNPLSERMIERWSLVACKVFKDIIFHEIDLFKKHEEQLNRLKNISTSTHAIKTTINSLFSPPLNSLLLTYPNDDTLKLLDNAKKKVLGYTEIINLISKLAANQLDKKKIMESLVNIGFYNENNNKNIDLIKLLEEINMIRQLGTVSSNLKFDIDNSLVIPNEWFIYDGLYPDTGFFELLLLTIIENVEIHGATDRKGVRKLTIKLCDNGIICYNLAKPNVKKKILTKEMTGNFRIFSTMLNQLEIGAIIPEYIDVKGKKYFQISLKSKYNDK